MTERAADVAAIEAILQTQELAFNTNDAEMFAGPWREQNTLVTR